MDPIDRHPADLEVSGEFTVEGEQFPTFTAPIEGDGSLKFDRSLVIEGVAADVAWQMNSAANGRATGTIREKYTAPGILRGDVTVDSNLSDFARNRAAVAPSLNERMRLIQSRIKAVRPR